MGTYTTNKNLFMPTVGETGWGTLVNTNFSTIDTYLKPISLSGSTYTFTGKHVGNQSGGSISATSITNSGTLTQTGTSTFTGKITANGGIGTKALATTSISNSGTLTNTGTSTFTGKITANGGIAGTTGTFSGVVTAKNVTKHGGYPYTVYLFPSTYSTIANNTNNYSNCGPNLGPFSINTGEKIKWQLMYSIDVTDGASLTVKSLYGLSNDYRGFITEIKKIGGSWSNPVVKTDDANITATISGISGTITNSGLTITYAQAVKLMSEVNTYTLKNTNAASTGYTNTLVWIEITNTSSSRQYVMTHAPGLYE